MSVAIDATGAHTNFSGIITSQTYSNLTVGAGATSIVMSAIFFDADPGTASAVWDSGGSNQAMTLISSQAAEPGTPIGTVQLWGLASPTLTPGNKNLVLNWTNATRVDMLAASYLGSATSFAAAFAAATPATGNSTAPSITLPSGAGHQVFGAVSDNAGNGISGCTVYNWDSFTSEGVSQASGAASVTLSATLATSALWAWCAVDILPGGGGGDTFANAGSIKFMRDKVGGLLKPVRKLLVPGWRPEPAFSF